MWECRSLLKPEVHSDPQGGGSGSDGHLLIACGPVTLIRGDGEQVICLSWWPSWGGSWTLGGACLL